MPTHLLSKCAGMWLLVLPHNDQVCGLARVTHEQNDPQDPVTVIDKAKPASIIHAGSIAMVV